MDFSINLKLINFDFSIDFNNLSSPEYFDDHMHAISTKIAKTMPYGLQSTTYGITYYVGFVATTIATIVEAIFKSSFNFLGCPFNLLGYSFAKEFHLRHVVFNIIPGMCSLVPFGIVSTALFFITIPYLIYRGNQSLTEPVKVIWTAPEAEKTTPTPVGS